MIECLEIFKGDDSDFSLNQRISVKLVCDYDLTGMTVKVQVYDYIQTYDPIPENKRLPLVFPASVTRKFPLGRCMAKIWLFDRNGKRRTIENRLAVLVTDSIDCLSKQDISYTMVLNMSYDDLRDLPAIGDKTISGRHDARYYGLATLEEIPEGAARPLPRYLHALSFDDTYIADARAWYETHGGGGVGGCSAVRRNGLLGRNYDWNYGEAAEFVVRVSAKEGRRASVGVASLGSELTEGEVCSGEYSPLYRILPGMTLDGINDAGVVAEINVIPRDATKDPVKGGTRNLHALEVVRYALDNYNTALAAATYVAAHYYIPDGAYSYHWMIADADGTYIVEDGEVIDTETTMTNYRVGVEDDPYGTGYARRAILGGEGSVADLLSAVRFTNAYATSWPWPDEFAAEGVGTHGDTEALRAWADEHVTPHLDPETRKPAARDGILWQTVHSSIYDFAAKTLSVAVQEDFDTRFVFAAESAMSSVSVLWGDIKGSISDQEDLSSRLSAKYEKPESGIPEEDLAASVVSSLGLADTASQPGHSHVLGDVNGLESALGDKREAPDYRALRRMCDIWKWEEVKAGGGDDEEIPVFDTPEDFLEEANLTNAAFPYYKETSGAWWYEGTFWPNGNVRYQISGGMIGSEDDSEVTFAFSAYGEDGATEEFRFSAKASRDPDSVSDRRIEPPPVSGNPFVRVATTDAVLRMDDKVREETGRLLERKYEKPDTGIPKDDLSDDVKASLDLADTALQEHQDISGKADLVNGKVPESQLPDLPELDDSVTEDSENGVKSSGIWSWVKGLLPSWLTPNYAEPATVESVTAKYTKPSDGIPKSDLVSSVQDSLDLADTALQEHQDISGKADKSTVYTKSETEAKIEANVENSTSSDSVTKALSAKMGKELQEQIQNLKQRGRYLSIWDCTTGLAKTEPTVNPYEYKSGDYFIVGTVGTTNYRPSGTEYDKTIPSTTVETGSPTVNDTYYFDGTIWSLLHTQQSGVSWDSIPDKPTWIGDTKPTYTALEVGADAAGTAAGAVAEHDAATTAHADLFAGKLDADDPVLTPTAPSVSASDSALAGAKLTGTALAALQTAIDRRLSEYSGADHVIYHNDGSITIMNRRLEVVFGNLRVHGSSDGYTDITLDGGEDDGQFSLRKSFQSSLPRYVQGSQYSVGKWLQGDFHTRGKPVICRNAVESGDFYRSEDWIVINSLADLFDLSKNITLAALFDAKLSDSTPVYSASATYAVGNFVRYNGVIHVCKTAITTAEAWTPAHWNAMPKVADFFSELNTKLMALIETTVNSMFDNGETEEF